MGIPPTGSAPSSRARWAAGDDPLWRNSGARDAADYARWAEHLCGVACLRMALAARGIAPPRALDLARELTARGGYVEGPDGAIRGLIYGPAADWLREAHGIAAAIRLDLRRRRSRRCCGAAGCSSPRSFRRCAGRTASRRRAAAISCWSSRPRAMSCAFHNPSGDTAATQADARLPLDRFARFYAERGIWLPG